MRVILATLTCALGMCVATPPASASCVDVQADTTSDLPYGNAHVLLTPCTDRPHSDGVNDVCVTGVTLPPLVHDLGAHGFVCVDAL